MIQRQVAKISGPLFDRIDTHIEVLAVRYNEWRAAAEGSVEIRNRVKAAHEPQHQRSSNANETSRAPLSNAVMSPASRPVSTPTESPHKQFYWVNSYVFKVCMLHVTA